MATKKRSPARKSQATPPGLAARAYAVKALREILRNGTQLEEALGETWASALPEGDKALVRAIVATSLRRKGQIDDVVNRFLSKPLPAKSGPVREILLCAGAQLLFMRVPAHAAIDLAVHLARGDHNGRHFSGLVNAVLRKVAGEGPDIVASQDAAGLNIPQWMLDGWQRSYGTHEAREIAAATLREAALDITPKDRNEHWGELLGGQELASGTIRIEDFNGRIENLPGYAEGGWWVQDAAAALPVKLLGDLRGKRILDLCAAPGGKTAQMAAAGADVVALDNSADRLERLAENMSRLKLDAEIVCADAANCQFPKPFDVVFADLPCSATGTLRRHPDGLVLKRPDLPAKLRPAQLAILRNAISLTRPGGTVLLCTCSLEAAEGEDLVAEILSGNLPVERHEITPAEIFGWDHMINRQNDLRILPSHSAGAANGLDGFFASRLRRL